MTASSSTRLGDVLVPRKRRVSDSESQHGYRIVQEQDVLKERSFLRLSSEILGEVLVSAVVTQGANRPADGPRGGPATHPMSPIRRENTLLGLPDRDWNGWGGTECLRSLF